MRRPLAWWTRRLIRRIPVTLAVTIVLLSVPFHIVANKIRVISDDELSTKTSKHGSVIWLSILGEVYDVSAGWEYYAEGESGYSIFAGRDGSVPFVTGKFDAEEAEKTIENLTPEQLAGIESWREFYEKEDKYPFVGVLQGYLYDKDGNPTDVLKNAQDIIAEEKTKAKKRDEERKAKIAERRKQKNQQNTNQASISSSSSSKSPEL